jgi:hypothetical protein
MENPYAASNLSAVPVAEGRKRRPLWKSLLIAFAVHHVFSWLGFLSGLLVVPGTEWQGVFPSDRPGFVVAKLFFFPLMMDGRTLVEPLFLDIVPPVVTVLRVIRFALVLTLPIAGIAYLSTLRPLCLWYLGIVSFFLGLLLFVTISVHW